MNTEGYIFLSNKKKRILLAVSSFLLLYFISYIIDPYTSYWEEYFKGNIAFILWDLLSSFVFCLLVSETSIYINNKLDKHILWPEYPGKRFALEITLNLINILILLISINFIFTAITGYQSPSVNDYQLVIEEKRGFIQWIVVSVLIGFFTVGINMINYLSIGWKNISIKAAKLDQIAAEAELEALKLQIDPHFVFNNLSILSELILKDQQLGYEYAESFSRIYRYMLVNSKKDVILLEDELKFLNSYIFLIEHRFHEGVNFKVEVDEKSRQMFIPPLILQILAENALKHNKTSRKSPLQIRIYNNDRNEIIIENNYQPVEHALDSSGIGIHNIIRRYSLLSEKKPEILQEETLFKVIIPLLNYDKYDTNN